jgi:hypothetical protein
MRQMRLFDQKGAAETGGRQGSSFHGATWMLSSAPTRVEATTLEGP